MRPAAGEQARAEAEWLLGELLGLSRLDLYLSDQSLEAASVRSIHAALQRRLAGEPTAYILGSTTFYGRQFAVGPAVLIPRPETERLVDEAAGWLRQRIRGGRPSPLVADLGTGSGAIAISLALAVPACALAAVELSLEALQVASANIFRHGLETRVLAIRADWTESLRGPFDLLISNPPYVRTQELDTLPSDVRHEPRASLDGGPDGMRVHRHLLARAPSLLLPGGALIAECAQDQAEALAASARTLPWARQVRILHDLAGRPRGLMLERANQ